MGFSNAAGKRRKEARNVPNMLDYMAENGDKSFRELPFGPVDGLVFAQLSYCDYQAANGELPASLKEIRPNVQGGIKPEDAALLNAAARYPRYADVVAYRFTSRFDEEIPLQFAAVTFLLPDGTAYISFRGTDSTLAGWKEDFQLAFMTPVPAQNATTGGLELQLVCLAWARIKDSNGAVVDLFPARLDDDMNMNGINHGTKLLAGNSAIAASLCGPEYGVVPVGSGAVVKLEDTAFPVSGTQATVAPAVGSLALYCNDPRYNFAPEDWYQVSVEGGVRATDWLSRVQAAKGDDDIFFAVSDAGYLQSVGELQNLPYTGEFGRNGGNFNPIKGAYYNQGKYDGVMRTQVGQLASVRDGNFAWQSYWAFDPAPHRTVADEQLYIYEDLKNAAGTKSLVDSVGGASVSRYTPNLYDWAVADRYFEGSGGSGGKGANGGSAAQDSIQKYCFNGHSGSEAPLDWDDLKEIAQKMQTHFRAGEPYDEWTDWGTANFFGLLGPNDGIHDVDRKFLYSYWRNCFEDNQQLYLMFVRAEPLMMMGGGDLNHTPAQLGGRAVALVWRDPARHPQKTQTASNNGVVPLDQPPHKMRVLFYHQFD